MKRNLKSGVYLFVFIGLFTCQLKEQVEVIKEQVEQGWNFKVAMRQSQSDIASNAKIYIERNKAMSSCLSPNGLHNGVLRNPFTRTKENPYP